MVYVVMRKSLSCVQLFATPRNSPGQSSRVGSCSLLQGYLPNPEIKSGSAALQVDSLPAELPGKPPSKKTAAIYTKNLFLWVFILDSQF